MSDKNRDAIAVVGAGKLGCALGCLLREAGEPVRALASRNPDHALAGAQLAGRGVRAATLAEVPEMAGRVLICVADDAIASVAAELAAAGMRGGAVLHTCGALGPEPLAPLSEGNASCGVLHPMQTIPSSERGLTALRGICWGITADGLAGVWARRIAGLLEGWTLDIAADRRALYHAAGVTAGNYFIALEEAANTMMEAAGVSRTDALAALAPMVESTLRNVFEMGPADALTGPVLRGDVETVRRHLEAIEALPDSLRELYRAAALHTVEIAQRRGLDEEGATRMKQLLRDNGVRNG